MKAADVSSLKPGHILRYKGVDWLGNTIDFFERGQWCHAALVYDATQLTRQNPGGPAPEALGAQPWANIEAAQLDLSSLIGKPGTPECVRADPHSDPLWLSFLPAVVASHKNDGYSYEAIDEFLKEGQLDELGLRGAEALLRDQQVPFFNGHCEVCSAYDVLILQEVTQKAYNWPEFRYNSEIQESEERPIDLSASPFYKVIFPV